MLRRGGRGLIYVWAVEQNKGHGGQDVLVPWSLQVGGGGAVEALPLAHLGRFCHLPSLKRLTGAAALTRPASSTRRPDARRGGSCGMRAATHPTSSSSKGTLPSRTHCRAAVA